MLRILRSVPSVALAKEGPVAVLGGSSGSFRRSSLRRTLAEDLDPQKELLDGTGSNGVQLGGEFGKGFTNCYG